MPFPPNSPLESRQLFMRICKWWANPRILTICDECGFAYIGHAYPHHPITHSLSSPTTHHDIFDSIVSSSFLQRAMRPEGIFFRLRIIWYGTSHIEDCGERSSGLLHMYVSSLLMATLSWHGGVPIDFVSFVAWFCQFWMGRICALHMFFCDADFVAQMRMESDQSLISSQKGASFKGFSSQNHTAREKHPDMFYSFVSHDYYLSLASARSFRNFVKGILFYYPAESCFLFFVFWSNFELFSRVFIGVHHVFHNQ